MECEKCKDVGFIEYEAGLLVQFCDCELGKKAGANQREILGYPETPPGPIMNEQFQSGVKDEPDDYARAGLNQLKQTAHELGIDFVEAKDDSISRTEPDTQSTGGGDTSEPKQPKKSKTKRKARKRVS